MPDYSKTLIYKIVCNDLNVVGCYVGSTTDFTRRKYVHKQDCNNPKKNNSKIYRIISENGGWDNWTMLEIEKFPCSSGNEARMREREVYEAMDSFLNSIRPYTSEVEQKMQNAARCLKYRSNNADKEKLRLQEFYKINREQILAKLYESRENVKEYKMEYYSKNKEKYREYYKNNKEKRAEQYQANREIISQRRKKAYQRKKQEKLLLPTV